MIKINKKLILLFTPLILLIAFYLFADYQIGRYTLKPGEKQEIHLKAGQGIEPLIYLKIVDIDGKKFRLSGEQNWTEVIDYQNQIYRFYKLGSKTISYFPKELKEEEIEASKRNGVKIDGDSLIIEGRSEITFELNGKEDVTIYVENPTDKTISFKTELTYR